MKQLLITVSFCYACLFGACQQKNPPKQKDDINNAAGYSALKKVDMPHFAIDALGKVDADDADKLVGLNIKDFSRAMPAGQRVQPDAKVSENEDTAQSGIHAAR